jgi:hypothetical protein
MHNGKEARFSSIVADSWLKSPLKSMKEFWQEIAAIQSPEAVMNNAGEAGMLTRSIPVAEVSGTAAPQRPTAKEQTKYSRVTVGHSDAPHRP